MSEHSDSFIDALNGTGKFGPPLEITTAKPVKVVVMHSKCDCVECLLHCGMTREEIAAQGWRELEAISGIKLNPKSNG